MSLKRAQPGLRFDLTSNAIIPQEIDRYEQYIVALPGIQADWFGTTAVSGTADTRALILRNAIADYPRNVRFQFLGSHDAIVATCIVNGRDQFGVDISETLTFSKASLGGTATGTKVFAQVTTGTVYFGTFAGNGTPKLGMGTGGTTTLFGLPFKIGGTGDIKNIAWQNGTGVETVGGGTIGAYVSTAMHAIKSPKDVVGTITMSVLAKPTYDPEGASVMAKLTQI